MRLELVPASGGSPLRHATAWLVPAAAAGPLVAELSRRGIDLLATRIAALPVGLFVMLPDDAEPQPHWPRGVRYGRLGGRVFGPIDAEPAAAVTPDEWDELFPGAAAEDGLVVWHPAAGVFSVAAAAVVRAADLLVPPPVERADWSRALPGVAFNGRIASLLPERLPAADEVFGTSADEIASEPLEAGRLPRAPGELPLPSRRTLGIVLAVIAAALAIIGLALVLPQRVPPGGEVPHADSSVAQDTRRPPAPSPPAVTPRSTPPLPWRSLVGSVVLVIGLLVLALLALAVRDTAAAAPAGGRGGGPSRESPAWGRMQAWLAGMGQACHRTERAFHQTLGQAFDRTFPRRHEREVRRLLHLLARDPDAGLRLAIPLTAEPGRGQALPAPGLMESPVDYGAAINGGRSYFLMLSNEQRMALVDRYRELANREIALGRHRRAAFIYARLLGDVSAAARMLLDGGHCREAAVLYEEKLGDVRQAARALERGGLLGEAVIRYEKLAAHEKLGELYALLGAEEESRAAFRRQVQDRLAAEDRLAAARVLADRLAAEDEALDVLAAGWPRSPQAGDCAADLLRRLGRLGRHARAREFVRAIATAACGDDGLLQPALAVLPGVALEHPDDQTRRLAADQTRLVAAAGLARKLPSDLDAILDSLAAVAPGDQVLERDARRFRERMRAARPAAPPRRTDRAVRGRLVQRDVRRLPPGVWTTLVDSGYTVWAAGIVSPRLAVARTSRSSGVQFGSRREWLTSILETEQSFAEMPPLLAVSAATERAVLRPRFGTAIRGEETFPAYGGEPPMVVGSHPAFATGDMPAHVWSMAFTGGVFDVVRRRVDAAEGDRWVWERYDAASDALVGTWPLPRLHVPEAGHASLAFRDDRVVMGIGTHVFVRELRGPSREIGLPGHVTGLWVSPPHTRLRIVAALDEGGVIIWGDVDDAPVTPFGAGLMDPRCCLLPTGLLVAATRGVVEVYDIRDGRPLRVARHEDDTLDPTAVAAAGDSVSTAFAILDRGGRIVFYDIAG